MVARRPVVVISGQRTELPPGDSIVGGSVGVLTAGSGLDGGGDLSSTTETNVSLAPNPSGLIFVDNKYLATDGVAQRTGETALASGNYALAAGTAALASGIAGSSLAATALASGNAALADITAIPGGTIETFTAASAVASGYAVGLDDTGSVQSVMEIIDVDSRSFGSSVVFESAASSFQSATYDSTNNKVVIAYQDGGNSSYGTAIVGTVSGTSISFGTPFVFTSQISSYFSSVYDSTNDRVVVAYRNDVNTYGTAKVGTVSGTSISFGADATFEFASTWDISAGYDSSNDRVVVAYRDFGNSNYGTAVVGAVSGTSISFGTAVVFESALTYPLAVNFDSANAKVVITYRDQPNSNSATAIVGTVSGSSISFGSAVAVAANVFAGTSTYDSTNNKIVLAYYDAVVTGNSFGVVGTVSGSSISFGTPVTFQLNPSYWPSCTYDSASDRVIITYQDSATSYGEVVVGAVSGTSISFGTPVVFESSTGVRYTTTVYDASTDRVVIAWRDYNVTDYGVSIVATPGSTVSPTISSQNNFIGIAQTTAASGSAVQVRLPGSYDQNNTGLTPGAVYYVNPTTSGFTTTATQPSSWSGAVNWGPIGRAVNSTTLLLTDMI